MPRSDLHEPELLLKTCVIRTPRGPGLTQIIGDPSASSKTASHCETALGCGVLSLRDPFQMFLSVLGNDMKSTGVIMWVMPPLMALTLFMIIIVI